MKYITLFLTLLITLLSAEENYCIEAFSYKQKGEIPKRWTKKIYKVIDKYQKARIVENGAYNSLHIGEFKEKREAKSLLYKIKKIFPEAIIKKCNNGEEKIIVESSLKNSEKQNDILNYNEKSIKAKVNIDKRVVNKKYKREDEVEELLNRTLNSIKRVDSYNPNNFLKGLYLKGEYQKSQNNRSSKYSLSFEYELFNNGFYEAKKRSKKYLIDTKIELYNSLEEIKNQTIKEKRDYLTIVKNRINYYYYKELKDAYIGIYKEKKRELDNNQITLLDMKEFENEMKNIDLYIELYQKSQKNRIDEKIYKIINKIENISLIEREKLIMMAEENNYNLKIQDSYIDKSKLLDSWWFDNLRVNFYLKREDNFGEEESFVGARVEIPFGSDSEKERLARLKEKTHQNQKRVLEIRNRQTIILLIENFNFIKQQIKILKNELSLLIDKYMIKRLKNLNFSTNSKNSKEDDLIDIKILEHKHKIILKRFELYKTLVNLQILCNSNNIYR